MKQKDMALILVIVFVSAVFSFLLSNVLFASPKNRQEKVEVVDKISTDFLEPDNKYFNANSVNPTQVIRIGENPNSAPFKQSN